ncbi:MAG: hypothetical protein ACKV0T_13810 [Planctomycetales bacterium]
MPVNVLFAWSWILCGLISGAVIGSFFHHPQWLDGYGSWRRRMVRLGHISFLGTGLLNLGYGLSVVVLQVSAELPWATHGFLVGGVTMPLVCFLSAWDDRWRRLFFLPVGSLLLATGQFLWVGLRS